MKIIDIDEIKDMDLMDVSYSDSVAKLSVSDLKEDMNYLQACDYINHLIAKYEMTDNDIIVTYLFDQESNLISTDKMTVKEYLETEV